MRQKIIMIIDLKCQKLIVKNTQKLPFVQIDDAVYSVDLKDIRHIQLESAFGIINRGDVIWDFCSYTPSWDAMSLDLGDAHQKLLFVSQCIGHQTYDIFREFLNIPMIRKKHYRRW